MSEELHMLLLKTIELATANMDLSHAIDHRLTVLERLLVARFDGVEETLAEHTALISSLNQLLAGLRSQSKSAFDVAISTQREIRRSSHPDELEQPIKERPKSKT